MTATVGTQTSALTGGKEKAKSRKAKYLTRVIVADVIDDLLPPRCIIVLLDVHRCHLVRVVRHNNKREEVDTEHNEEKSTILAYAFAEPGGSMHKRARCHGHH